jgi:hypothetical protein
MERRMHADRFGIKSRNLIDLSGIGCIGATCHHSTTVL